MDGFGRGSGFDFAVVTAALWWKTALNLPNLLSIIPNWAIMSRGKLKVSSSCKGAKYLILDAFQP